MKRPKSRLHILVIITLDVYKRQVVNRDSKTGLNYLSIKGNEAQGVSVIITSDKVIETLNKLADEFQKYPVSAQRSTAGLDVYKRQVLYCERKEACGWML